MLLSFVSVLACSGSALGIKFGLGDGYGSDIKFDGIPMEDLETVIDLPSDTIYPLPVELDRPTNVSSRMTRQTALFRQWPRGSAVSTVFGFVIPFKPKGQFEMRFPFIFFVNQLIDKFNSAYGRHFARDQFSMYRSMETGLVQGLAIEGKECVLRAICDAAEVNLAKFSLLGEVLGVVLTPKQSRLPEMSAYSKAYKEGKKYGKCNKLYPDCPLSLESLFPVAWLSKKK